MLLKLEEECDNIQCSTLSDCWIQVNLHLTSVTLIEKGESWPLVVNVGLRSACLEVNVQDHEYEQHSKGWQDNCEHPLLVLNELFLPFLFLLVGLLHFTLKLTHICL